MLKDIVEVTKFVFNQVLESNKDINSIKNLYDTYRVLEELRSDISLVANHYLALDFNESYLQNSSWGEPVDKWRRFLNKDLKNLNNSTIKYLIKLRNIAFYEEYSFMNEGSFLSKKYNDKYLYSFIRNEYNVGYVESCQASLIITQLDIKKCDNKTLHIAKYKRIELDTYEQRVFLQKNLLEKKVTIEEYLLKIKNYILSRYTLEDLV